MMRVRCVIGEKDDEKEERPGAVFACYADLCEALVAGERRSRV